MTESEKFLTTINRINQQCSQAVSAMPGSQCSGALWESGDGVSPSPRQEKDEKDM